ncbi:MAG: hypothetical protein AB7O96_06920 [Pseudobdellovibrionaceae bacterium]
MKRFSLIFIFSLICSMAWAKLADKGPKEVKKNASREAEEFNKAFSQIHNTLGIAATNEAQDMALTGDDKKPNVKESNMAPVRLLNTNHN